MAHYIDTMAYERATGAPWHAGETEADGRTRAVDGVMDGEAMLRESRTDWTVSLHPVSVLMDPRPKRVEVVPGGAETGEIVEDWTHILESPDTAFGAWLAALYEEVLVLDHGSPTAAWSVVRLRVSEALQSAGASEYVLSDCLSLLPGHPGMPDASPPPGNDEVHSYLLAWVTEPRKELGYAVDGHRGDTGWESDWNHVFVHVAWHMRKRTKFDEITAPEFNAVVRDDTRTILAVVGSRFHPVQQRQMITFLEAIVGQGLEYETGGSLMGGTKVWYLARMPEDMLVAGGRDRVRRYLMVANSHDGSAALTVKFVLMRVVCWNTWTAALSERSAEIRIRHTVSATSERAVREAQRVLGIANQTFAEFEAIAAVLCQLSFSPEDMRALVHYLVPPAPISPDLTGRDPENVVFADPDPETRAVALDGTVLAYTRAKAELVEWLIGAMDKAPGNADEGVKGTAWAAFNAITYWTSHFRDARVSSRRAASGMTRDELVREARLDSLWFGEGRALAERAQEYLLDIAANRGLYVEHLAEDDEDVEEEDYDNA